MIELLEAALETPRIGEMRLLSSIIEADKRASFFCGS